MRLIVKTVTDPNVEGSLYRVDVSKGLKHFLRMLSKSSDIGFKVQSLKLITIKDGEVVTTPIRSLQTLDELDIVLATGDAAPIAVSTPARAKTSSSATAVVSPIHAGPSAVTESRGGSTGRTGSNLSSRLYPVGTKVRKLWFAQGWFDGVVTSIDKKLKCYHVRYDDGDEEDVEMGESFDEMVRRASEKDVVVPPLSDQQRSELQGIGIDLEDFGDFLYYELGLTHEDARSVYHPVVRLRSGEGITCPDWPKEAFFHPFVVDDMGKDFNELIEEAKQDEEFFGEDESMNRTLLGPLKTLVEYQKYYYYKKLPQNAMNARDQAETESMNLSATNRGSRRRNGAEEAQPSRKRRAATTRRGGASTGPKKCRGTPLSIEQRLQLTGTAIDIDHLENFLSEIEQLASITLGSYLRVVKGLKDGTGFAHKVWPSRAVFHAQPVYMDEDFGMLYSDAEKHEGRYGKVPGSGLRSAIRKLEKYQQHFYHEMQLEDQQQDTVLPLEQTPTKANSDNQEAPTGTGNSESDDRLQNEAASVQETQIRPNDNTEGHDTNPITETTLELVTSEELAAPKTDQIEVETANSDRQEDPVVDAVLSNGVLS